MAARLTDRQKKKIVADYLETESYNATAKKNGVCGQTVRRVVEESQGITENLKRKKEQNTTDILAYMESKRDIVCEILPPTSASGTLKISWTARWSATRSITKRS